MARQHPARALAGTCTACIALHAVQVRVAKFRFLTQASQVQTALDRDLGLYSYRRAHQGY
jgi:hypothetical protein